jgi:integrase
VCCQRFSQQHVRIAKELTALALAALTGIRQSEIRGLQWQDFDGKTTESDSRMDA